jgi:hypothetical protein
MHINISMTILWKIRVIKYYQIIMLNSLKQIYEKKDIQFMKSIVSCLVGFALF